MEAPPYLCQPWVVVPSNRSCHPSACSLAVKVFCACPDIELQIRKENPINKKEKAYFISIII
jgi:hypothetical protein